MNPSTCHIELKDVDVSYYLGNGGARLRPGAPQHRTGPALGARMQQRKRFIEIKALRGITLRIDEGARVGLVGVNGSGKSTLLKLCAGTLKAQSGRVDIVGQVNPQFSLSSGMRPQLTGRQNARLKCLYFNVPSGEIPEQIERIKEASGLEDYFDLPVRIYSAGMRSRLSMSVLGLLSGEILIMDEWISAADASINALASHLQKRLMDTAKMLVMASHSEGVLRKWTDRLVWLHQGEIRAVGGHDEVLSAYRAHLEATSRS